MHVASSRKSKDWLALNQDNVSKWGDMSISGLLFQWATTIKIQLSVLVYTQYKADFIIISLKINLISPWYSWKIAEIVLNNNHPLPFIKLTSVIMNLIWLKRHINPSVEDFFKPMLQLLLHYVENAQENKENTILSYNRQSKCVTYVTTIKKNYRY
jgi:hypothetical protein